MLADVNARIIQAMKAHDAPTLSALRMLKTALTVKEVEKGRALETGEALQVVASLIKQRRDSIEQFQKGGRLDLVQKERFELALLEAMMPPPIHVNAKSRAPVSVPPNASPNRIVFEDPSYMFAIFVFDRFNQKVDLIPDLCCQLATHGRKFLNRNLPF